MHYCYALSDGDRRSYIGYTVDPARRIRQHNREICGGAWRTRMHPSAPPTRRWEYVFVVTVLHAEFGKHEALSMEWHLQRTSYPVFPTEWVGNTGYLAGRRQVRRRTREPDVLKRLDRVLSLPQFERFREHAVVLVTGDRVDEAWELLAPGVDGGSGDPTVMVLEMGSPPFD